jgi:carbon-monoxide dehydrogenase medium subunit
LHAIDYTLPRSVNEAVSLLAQHGDSARIMAGGTDILVQLRAGRRSNVNVLVDVKQIPELNEFSYTPQRGLTLGAAVPCYRIYEDPAIQQVYPSIVDSAALIGSVQIQGRASLGGNICNAAPSGDSIPALIALGTVCDVAGPRGTRQISLEKFFVGPGRTVLENNEILVNIHVPAPAANSSGRYLRFIPRNEMDIAVAGAGVAVTLDASKQRFVSARVALASVAPTPLFVEEAGRILTGQPVSEQVIERAAQAAVSASKPITDMRGTIDVRKHLVGVLTRRALNGAIQRVRGEQVSHA